MEQFYKELQALLGKYNVQMYADSEPDMVVFRKLNTDDSTEWHRVEFISESILTRE